MGASNFARPENASKYFVVLTNTEENLLSVNAEILDTISHEALTDKGFMDLSRRKGLIYKLNYFQNALNSQKINMENYWVRIIEVNKPTTVWEFVEQNLPDYYKSDEVAESNDLQKIVDGEINGDAEELFKEIGLKFGTDYNNIELIGEDERNEIINEAQRRLHEVNAYLFEESIKNFLKNTCDE